MMIWWSRSKWVRSVLGLIIVINGSKRIQDLCGIGWSINGCPQFFSLHQGYRLSLMACHSFPFMKIPFHCFTVNIIVNIDLHQRIWVSIVDGPSPWDHFSWRRAKMRVNSGSTRHVEGVRAVEWMDLRVKMGLPFWSSHSDCSTCVQVWQWSWLRD